MNVDAYVLDFASRLRARSRLRWLAGWVIGLLLFTALATWIAVAWVPSPGVMLAARLFLYLAIAVGAMCVWRLIPGQEVVVTSLESRLVDADGRFRTLLDARRRGDESSLLPLLARQCEDLAENHRIALLVPARELVAPALMAFAAAAALLAALVTGTSYWQLAAQRLWIGDLVAETQPRIRVLPGDVVIPRGVDVIVEAQAFGFESGDMQVNAMLEGADDWQRVAMSRLAQDKYGFVFVAVGDEIDYFVSTRALRSERFTIRVADLPRVTSLSLVYQFPDWTNLPVAEHSGGDVVAVQGTQVAVAIATDKPADAAVLVVNDEVLPMDAVGASFAGAFSVAATGSWHVAVPHEGDLARISDVYRIEVAADRAPEVVFAWPGADRQATAIEEVGVRFTADDDFGVQALELNYSVNGGAWSQVALDLEDGDHLLYLEDLQADDQRRLVPGDVISLFAEARDHQQVARTALYFVDVRPFDRRYRESQQMGGGAGGGGSDIDMAERQKELLSATWNLINKRRNGDSSSAELESEAAVIAMLQGTLKEQVEVLIQRAGARGLERDEELRVFVEKLELAAAQMGPAALALENNELDEAVPAEQRALTHLRTAEAAVPEINVSLAQSSSGSGGSRDSLSELVDLEMDPERNRYEMPEAPGNGESSAAEDPEWQRLQELAARQEQLAELRLQGQETLASRWQQSKLKRELEELREQLKNRRRGSSRSTERTERIDQAISSLEQAERALQDQQDPNSDREARRSLQKAMEAMRQEGAGAMRRELADIRRRADNLVFEQQQVMDRFDQTRRRTLDDNSAEEVNPWRDFSMVEDAATKRRMRETLSDLRRDLSRMVQVMSDDGGRNASLGRPELGSATDLLQQAQRDLDEDRIEERLVASAEAFEMGRPLYAADYEEVVEAGLERLATQLSNAEQRLGEALAGAAGDTPLRQVRELRESLAAAQRNGQVSAAEVRRVAGAARLLAGDVTGNNTEAGRLLRDYQTLGIDSANDERLYQLTLEQLDMLESAILELDAAAMQAQASRDRERDSSAAADYFRALGKPD